MIVAALFLVCLLGSCAVAYFAFVARHRAVRGIWSSALGMRAARSLQAGLHDLSRSRLAGEWFGAKDGTIPSATLPPLDPTAAWNVLGDLLEESYEDVRKRRVKVGSLLAFCSNAEDEALAVFAGTELRETARSKGRRARKAPAVILLPSNDDDAVDPVKAKLRLQLMRVRLKKRCRTLTHVPKASVRWLLADRLQDLVRSIDKLKRKDAWIVTKELEIAEVMRKASKRSRSEHLEHRVLQQVHGIEVLRIRTRVGFDLLHDVLVS